MLGAQKYSDTVNAHDTHLLKRFGASGGFFAPLFLLFFFLVFFFFSSKTKPEL